MAATILEKIHSDGDQDNIHPLCSFTAEQLRLLSSPPNSRRYSPFLLSNAAVWERTSPHLYKLLYCSGTFCLPHPKTLKKTHVSTESG